MEDRNRVRTSITGPEGADFDFTDKVTYEITQQLLDSIPEKNVVSLLLRALVAAVEAMPHLSVWVW